MITHLLSIMIRLLRKDTVCVDVSHDSVTSASSREILDTND